MLSVNCLRSPAVVLDSSVSTDRDNMDLMAKAEQLTARRYSSRNLIVSIYIAAADH